MNYFTALHRESYFLLASIFIPPVLFTGPHQFGRDRCTDSNQLTAGPSVELLAYGPVFTVFAFRLLEFRVSGLNFIV